MTATLRPANPGQVYSHYQVDQYDTQGFIHERLFDDEPSARACAQTVRLAGFWHVWTDENLQKRWTSLVTAPTGRTGADDMDKDGKLRSCRNCGAMQSSLHIGQLCRSCREAVIRDEQERTAMKTMDRDQCCADCGARLGAGDAYKCTSCWEAAERCRHGISRTAFCAVCTYEREPARTTCRDCDRATDDLYGALCADCMRAELVLALIEADREEPESA